MNSSRKCSCLSLLRSGYEKLRCSSQLCAAFSSPSIESSLVSHLLQNGRDLGSFIPYCKQLDRLLAEQEFIYYATGLFWLRNLEIKAKQGRTALTSAEKDIRKETQADQFNVPQPLQIYLSQIGDLTDAGGKRTEIEIPALPTAVAGGLGGYHHAQITLDTHNLYEEVPCLGIAADAVMALQANNNEPDYRVTGPLGSVINLQNLCGASEHIATPRDEIRRRLTGQGITAAAFPEYVANTRFNVRYMRQISDLVGSITTFRNEKLVIANLGLLDTNIQFDDYLKALGTTKEEYCDDILF